MRRSYLNHNNNGRIKKERRISQMINSSLFFLHHVFILDEAPGYRLIVVQNKEKLFDLQYKTPKEAKDACFKLIGKKAFSHKIKPLWSIFYPVEESWLNEKLSYSQSPNKST